MRLLTVLVLRLLAVVLFCLTVTTVWIVVSAHSNTDAATSQSAARVEKQLQGLYWQLLVWRDGLDKTSLLPLPEWRSLTTQSLIAPGVCVTFSPPRGEKSTLCSQTDAIGPAAPAWFSQAYAAVLGPHQPITSLLSVRDKKAGTVVTFTDSDAALRLAWSQVSTVVGIASVMAGAIALLAALMIGHALMPAQVIINVLHQLKLGDLSRRLPSFRGEAFNTIAGAVNDLAENLLRTRNESQALTAKLFQVQEEERRALARDLHDEFGQSLTATAALAALIEASSEHDRHEIAADARAISRIQQDMMDTLRTTLVRLRSQSIEEVGLEASLRQLVADYNTQSASRAVCKLDVSGRLAALHRRVAVDIYRIAQECLTNATRHGSPTEINVRVEHVDREGAHVALVVEDDGGGDVRKFKSGSGHGLLGMRERIAALGGALSIANVAHGIRVSATIPLRAFGPSGAPLGEPA
jgi:two-component system, NarL family, sensor histidine kinase UhpB